MLRSRSRSTEKLINGDRLESWKEIAAYFGRGVRTIQRWERTEGLPVHRHVHERKATIFACRSELDGWLSNRGYISETAGDSTAADAGIGTGRHFALWIWAVALLAFVTAAWYFLHKPPASLGRELTARPFAAYLGRAFGGKLSPNGKWVVYSWFGESAAAPHLYAKNLETSAVVRLTNSPEREAEASWSPDSEWIVFAKNNRTLHTIHVSGRDGRDVADFGTVAHGGIYGVTWSPDGRWLVVSHKSLYQQPAALYALQVENAEPAQISFPTANSTGDRYPVFSPDGKSLLFLRDYRSAASEIFLLRLTNHYRPAGDPIRLTFDNRKISGADWLPGGRGVLFSSDRESTQALWTLDVNHFGKRDTKPQRLAFVGHEGHQPSVSRNTNRMVYWKRNWNTDIWRVRLEKRGESAPVRLVGSAREELDPQYSPEGRRIAFISTQSGNAEIWVCEADGSQERQVTSFSGPQIHHPRWRPDSDELAFHSGPEGQSEIFVVSVKNKQVRRLTNHPANDFAPSWSRDGKWVYFSSNRSGVNQVWKKPAGGGSAVQVTDGGGHDGVESWDGKWLYFRNEGLWRMAKEGGAAARVTNFDIGYYIPVEDGIYFQALGVDNGPLQFFRFSSQKVEAIAGTQHQAAPGISVSMDGQYILFSAYRYQASELMLVENFE